jgi:hypothetical protein
MRSRDGVEKGTRVAPPEAPIICGLIGRMREQIIFGRALFSINAAFCKTRISPLSGAFARHPKWLYRSSVESYTLDQSVAYKSGAKKSPKVCRNLSVSHCLPNSL